MVHRFEIDFYKNRIHLNNVNFSIHQVIEQQLLFNQFQTTTRFGCYNYNYAIVVNKKFMITDLKYIIASLRKMLFITAKVALFHGVFLTYISRLNCIDEATKVCATTDNYLRKYIGHGWFHKKYLKGQDLINFFDIRQKLEKFREYFSQLDISKRSIPVYILLTSGFFGFVSNFRIVFLNHIKIKKKNWKSEWPTNYNSYRLPSIVFITKTCYNEYYKLFRVFFKKRIICIRTFSLVEEVNIHVGYCLSVNDCSRIHAICESIFWLNHCNVYNKW